MATATAERSLPRANVRDPGNPFPDEQYVKVANVAIFSEHETKTPEGAPQRFDQDALQRLIDRGNERIAVSGDYAAVCVGHTHDPDSPNGAEEQPEVIGAMGPYRLGLLGHPGRQQKYAILADLWIRRDKIDKYNAHPRRSVELWYEHDRPAWIDPLSLLTEAPRLDLGLTPLIPTDVGGDGAELKYLYSALYGGLRRVKYAAACAPAAGNVFVPAETEAPKRKYAAAGEMGDPANVINNQQTTKENLMLAPEDIRQICDAIEQLDVVVAMRDFMPLIPRLQDLMAKEDTEHAAMNEVPGEVPPAVDEAGVMPPPAEPSAPAAPPEPAAEPPAPPAAPAEKPPEKLPEDLEKVKHSADEATDPNPKDKGGTSTTHLDDMSEEEIERYLCARKAKYSADSKGPDGKATDAPATGDVDPGKATPSDGSVAGETPNAAAKYSALEAKLAELERDRIERTNESRKAKLTQLRYHRAFDLEKEVTRTTYARMSDEQFRNHVDFIAEVATPTLANQPMPVPDELLDGAQPAPAVRQGPEKYTKEKADEAVRICYERQQAGKSASYEMVLDALVKGQPIPE